MCLQQLMYTGPYTKRRHYWLLKEKSSKIRKIEFTLLEALWLPLKVTIIHCTGHQKGTSEISLFLYALYGPRDTPYTLGLTSFEILYGRLSPMLPNIQSDILAEHKFIKSFVVFHRVQKQLWPTNHQAYESAPSPNLHYFEPGGKLWIKRQNHKILESYWKVPHTMVLVTFMTVKVAGIRIWIDHSYIKPVRRETTQKSRSCPRRLSDKLSKQQWKITPHWSCDLLCSFAAYTLLHQPLTSHPTPIKYDLITMTWFGNTQTLGVGFRIRRTPTLLGERLMDFVLSPFTISEPTRWWCTNIVKFTVVGKKLDWTAWKTQGLRLYISGYNPGLQLPSNVSNLATRIPWSP